MRDPYRSIPRTSLALALLVASVLFANLAQAGSATYCIEGNSTGKGWTFALECADGSTVVGGGSVADGAVPAGSTCATLAEAFVDLVNQAPGQGMWTATLDPDNPCYFTVSNPLCASGDIRLTVTTEGIGSCTVGIGNPCSFNPTITLLEPPIPVELESWGRHKVEQER